MAREYLAKSQIRGFLPQTEDILLTVDFREQLYSQEVKGNAGAYRAYTCSRDWYTNEKMCFLRTDVESPSDSDYAQFISWVPVPASLNYRFVSQWTWQGGGTDYIMWRIELFDGTYYHDARVRYVPSSNAWEYLDENNTWQTIGTQKLHYNARHVLEFSVNFKDEVCKSIVSNGKEFDLSNYKYHKTSSTVGYTASVTIRVYSNGTGAGTAFVWWLYVVEG